MDLTMTKKLILTSAFIIEVLLVALIFQFNPNIYKFSLYATPYVLKAEDNTLYRQMFFDGHFFHRITSCDYFLDSDSGGSDIAERCQKLRKLSIEMSNSHVVVLSKDLNLINQMANHIKKNVESSNSAYLSLLKEEYIMAKGGYKSNLLSISSNRVLNEYLLIFFAVLIIPVLTFYLYRYQSKN